MALCPWAHILQFKFYTNTESGVFTNTTLLGWYFLISLTLVLFTFPHITVCKTTRQSPIPPRRQPPEVLFQPRRQPPEVLFHQDDNHHWTSYSTKTTTTGSPIPTKTKQDRVLFHQDDNHHWTSYSTKTTRSPIPPRWQLPPEDLFHQDNKKSSSI